MKLPGFLRTLFSTDHEIPIDAESWLGRKYFSWKAQSGFDKGPGFRENLCHFFRVAVIWSFWGWFTRKHQVWTASVDGSYLDGFDHQPCDYEYCISPGSIESGVLHGGYVALMVFLLGAVFWLVSQPEDGKVFKVLKIVSLPVLGPIYVLGKIVIFLYTKVFFPVYIRPYPHQRWVYVSTLVILVVLLQLLGILLDVLIVLGIIAVAVVITFAILFTLIEGGPMYKRWRKNRRLAQNRAQLAHQTKPQKGFGPVKLAVAMSKAKRGSRICPYITFVGNVPAIPSQKAVKSTLREIEEADWTVDADWEEEDEDYLD